MPSKMLWGWEPMTITQLHSTAALLSGEEQEVAPEWSKQDRKSLERMFMSGWSTQSFMELLNICFRRSVEKKGNFR